MIPRIWILVTDVSRARLFAQEGRHVDEVGDFIHAEGSLPVRALVSDQQGRRGTGLFDRPGLSQSTDPKEVEAWKFAQKLAGMLKHGLDVNEYDSLILVAPPHFLGILRKTLDHQVAKRLTTSLDKNFIDLKPPKLLKQVLALETAAHA